MSRDLAIKVDKLSKKYKIGVQKDGSLRGTLASLFKKSQESSDIFWALKDLSFEIPKGGVVGIIGQNGAGKSTLLKVLSKITEPTTGRIEINGRVASLLEVGTGFHPELTGRENVYLNGTILGMTRKEIKSKFDEIVSFSGVEKFIDTPVKHYSSGMYVRLAFAVAAHLEPEILIIDEVLAVGDAEFQKKCLGKMQDVAGQGRTVLFVSHDLVAVQKLCPTSILIKDGEMALFDETSKVINQYLSSTQSPSNKKLSEIIDRQGNGELRFTDAYWKEENSDELNIVNAFNKSELHLLFDRMFTLEKIRVDIGINNDQGIRVAWLSTRILNSDLLEGVERNEIVIRLEQLNLRPGNYTCNLFCESKEGVTDWMANVLPFTIADLDYYSSGKKIPSQQGYVLLNYKIN